MKKQYLHLSAYVCDQCRGPVVSGWLTVRENEISKETDIRPVGAICLSCGHRQSEMTEPGFIREFPPAEWKTVDLTNVSHRAPALAVMLKPQPDPPACRTDNQAEPVFRE